jgi:hypothetical protein
MGWLTPSHKKTSSTGSIAAFAYNVSVSSKFVINVSPASYNVHVIC